MMNGQKPLDYFSVTIPAGTSAVPGSVKIQQAGVSFYIRQATGEFQMQFDAGTVFTAAQGYAFEDPTANLAPYKRFNSVTLFNSTNVAITVQGHVGQMGVRYIGTDNVKNAATFLRGNLGNGSTPFTTAQSSSGLYQGHRRKTLIVTVWTSGSASSATYLDITDSSNNIVTRIFPGSAFTGASNIVAIDTDAAVTMTPNGGVSFVASEIFYSN